MREIEKLMVNAVNGKYNFSRSNTQVIVKNNSVSVWLHFNPIFAKIGNNVYYSNCGWNTRTTASRLRALGADYSTNYKKCNCDLISRSAMINLLNNSL